MALEVVSAGLVGSARLPTWEELSVCEELCTLVTTQQCDQDQDLFPRLAARHSDLGAVLRSLREDHAVVARLVRDLRAACAARRHVGDLHARVDELRAVVLTHFEAERRQLRATKPPPPT